MSEYPKGFLRRTLPSIVCTTFLAVSLFGCGGGGDSQGRIVGTVYDGDPAQETRTAAGTKVYVSRQTTSSSGQQVLDPVAETTTDQNGRFSVSVPSGSYAVYAGNGYGFYGNPANFCTVFDLPKVTSGQTSTVTLGYVPCSGEIP